ncbi:MAG: lycopene beta-cyclase CrtY, partial [Xanthomonadaceae bacterium]|nr:lycopene beta-cyclase CrtY [Xanthomonadaceae bacterium]
MNSMTSDLVLAGGGLANCLIAWRVACKHPGAAITIVEAGPEPGGNHTWSFHGGDLRPDQLRAIEPLIDYRWSAQKVAFPGFERSLDTPYFSIRSGSLQRFIRSLDRIDIRTDCRVSALGQQWVRTKSGEVINASAVIDGRGPGRSDGLVLGFQKFFGREVRTREPHGLTAPVIMDATVSQHDGYRFVYLLPFSADQVLIEDTRYSDGNALDERSLRRAIDQYAAAKGWTIVETMREEHGVLPILLAGDLDHFWSRPEHTVARSGLAAGLFHPTTGYSLPQAIALADEIAAHWPLDGAA